MNKLTWQKGIAIIIVHIFLVFLCIDVALKGENDLTGSTYCHRFSFNSFTDINKASGIFQHLKTWVSWKFYCNSVYNFIDKILNPLLGSIWNSIRP